jgi:Ala-tRNA(Pro) deacylase
MAIDRNTLFTYLKQLGIEATTVEHEPVFTVEQSAGLRATIPGAHTKSLFLTDKDGHLVLVVAKDDTRVDMKKLAKGLGLGRLSLGKPELLESVLGVAPGSVTPLALLNDTTAPVAVVVDEALMNFAEVNCHPLENTATTRIATAELLRFIEATCHRPSIMKLG